MKNEKSYLKRFILFAILITGGLFTQLYFSNSIRMLTKNKNVLENDLLLAKDRLEDKLVEIQKLISKERISRLANKNLGLVKAAKPFEKIYINHSRAKKIVQIVEKKYD